MASSERSVADAGSRMGLNALIGAVATILAVPLLPLAVVVGGGTAGYLQHGTRRDGALAGAFAGFLAAIPAVAVTWFLLGHLLFGLANVALVASPFGLAAVFLVCSYYVVAGGLGGALGTHLHSDLL